MLRMTPLSSMILLVLLSGQLQAAEETFDTNFMIGGMKGEKSSSFHFADNQPLHGNMNWIFTSISNGVVNIQS